MIIAGAGGHAKEIFSLFEELQFEEEIFFYDTINKNIPDYLYNRKILKNDREAAAELIKKPNYVIGVGNPSHRKILFEKFNSFKGIPANIISPFARIGNHDVKFGTALNIFTNVIISNDVSIGTGTLIHMNTTIHHDCVIGSFCEISPSCNILGHVKIGDNCSIGTGSIILPNLTIGNNITIGAGSVVTKDVKDHSKIKGIPAK